MDQPPPLAVHEATVRGVTGWLVIDRLRDGLSFGGFRFSPGVTEQEVRDLARAMTWKLALHGLPVGGAKAGLRCRPGDPDLPDILAGFAEAWRGPLGDCTVLGKDMGATDALLDALYDALGTPQLALARRRHPHCPKRIRDLTGYVRHMTGRGAAWAAEAAAGSLIGRRVAIQGAGLVGIGTAVRVAELGGRVVGISDLDGTVAWAEGLPVEGLLAATAGDARSMDRTRAAFPHRRLDRDALLGLEADILVLAAGSRAVEAELAGSIRAPLLVEASNLGLTEAAHDVLAKAGVTVVPDVIASSSSAALVAHQIARGNQWPPDALWTEIATAIRRAVTVSAEGSKAKRVTMRQAYRDHYGAALRQAEAAVPAR